VKERTGYPVSVTPLENQSSHVSMRSATRDTPAHAIFPNPLYERFANYLVATQCAMILFKWADPEGVSDFIVNDQKADLLKRKIVGTFPAQAMPAATAKQYAESLVNGLVLQLTSSPLEILSVDWCFREYPELRVEQEAYVNAHLRELSATLAPNIRKMTPREIYDRAVPMNAAYTLRWADLSGERVGLLPYETLGFVKPARDLLNDLESIPSDAPDVYRRSVDAWAARLDLIGWYRWNPRQT
jgi:hypothetical protein